MRIKTYGPATINHGIRTISINKEAGNCITAFSSFNFIENFVHLHLTPDEARKYAQQLIIAADKLDPIDNKQ